MAMPPYPIHCQRAGCENPAVYKIAARWSDGVMEELKTYALCCAACLDQAYARSLSRQRACRRSSGELLETPEIYRLERGARDHSLKRCRDLEEKLSGE